MRTKLILNVRSQSLSSVLLEEKHRDSESAGNSLRSSGGSQKCISDQENDGKINWKTETGDMCVCTCLLPTEQELQLSDPDRNC